SIELTLPRLTARTEVGGSSSLDDARNWCSAPATRFSFSVVDSEARSGCLAVPCSARQRYDAPHCSKQGRDARGRKARRCYARTDSRSPKRFGSVDVSQSGHHSLIEQNGLDRRAPLRERQRQAIDGQG